MTLTTNEFERIFNNPLFKWVFKLTVDYSTKLVTITIQATLCRQLVCRVWRKMKNVKNSKELSRFCSPEKLPSHKMLNWTYNQNLKQKTLLSHDMASY